jgi:glucosamine-phosphate N-acetyltransferase
MLYNTLLYLCHEYPLKDVKEGYLRLLSYLTSAPYVSDELFMKSIREIFSHGIIQIAYTLEDKKIFIHGSATILYETKIIHGCKKVGHIEDVVVSPNYRNQGIATSLLSILKKEAAHSCYKIILDCKYTLMPVYEKSGLIQNGIQMSYYFA